MLRIIFSKSAAGSIVAPVPAAGVRTTQVRVIPEKKVSDETKLSNEAIAVKLLDEATNDEDVSDVKRLMAVMKKANREQ